MREDRDTVVRRTTDLMRVAILSGAMPRQLPQEFDLQRSYGVGRNVVREALDALRREGLIERHQGTGTFAIGHRFLHRIDRAAGFIATEAGSDVRRERLAFGVVEAVPVVLDLLELEGDPRVLMLERVTIAAGAPTSLWTSYIPPRFEQLVASLGPYDRVRDRIAEDAASEVDTVVSSVAAALTPGSVAEILHIPGGAPSLRQERVTRLKNGLVAEFAIGWSRGDRFTLQAVRPS